MLRPLPPSSVQVGQPVFLVTRRGEIIEGFKVAHVMLEHVLLDRPPLPDSEKQGFIFDGDILKPSWCAGRKAFRGAALSRERAEQMILRKAR